MIDADAYAVLLADWCLDVQPDQQILVLGTTLAEELGVALHRAILERGAWPHLRLSPAGLEADFYHHAQERHLDGFAPLSLLEFESVDASLRIEAPATDGLAGIDPSLPMRAARARRPLQRARLARRWAVAIWPTPVLAQHARMPLADYEAFVERALFLDRASPVSAWRELSARQAQLVQRLDSAEIIRIENQHTDLTLNVAGRRWQNSDGRRNMPSGEVFTSPHEQSANGTIVFDLPSMEWDAPVSGVRLEFADGQVVAAHAEVGDEHLQAALAIDDGARFLGEIGIGTNTGI
ncbi:MAG TPA: aminopeptidase, partial [Solirubrobacteraceae bacterium]|nr:aminopeptidase [Solirubrobacteraceae bacterium]